MAACSFADHAPMRCIMQQANNSITLQVAMRGCLPELELFTAHERFTGSHLAFPLLLT